MMMNIAGPGAPVIFALLWAIHAVAAVLFGIGILFLVVWAIKSFSHEKLKMTGIWFVIFGIVACLFTVAVRGGPWAGGKAGMMHWGNGIVVDRGMMQQLREDMTNYKSNDKRFLEMRETMEKMMGAPKESSSSSRS